MAQYEHLPIYKKAMDLAVYIENVVRGFSKYHKYTLGTDLRNLSRAVVRLIIRANSERDRLATLFTLRDTIEELKVCMRICKRTSAVTAQVCRKKTQKLLKVVASGFIPDDESR